MLASLPDEAPSCDPPLVVESGSVGLEFLGLPLLELLFNSFSFPCAQNTASSLLGCHSFSLRSFFKRSRKVEEHNSNRSFTPKCHLPLGLRQLDGIVSFRPVRPVSSPFEPCVRIVDMSTSPLPVASIKSTILGLDSVVV